MATAFGLASLKPSELSGVSDYQLDSLIEADAT
jgi:hypothetical protein